MRGAVALMEHFLGACRSIGFSPSDLDAAEVLMWAKPHASRVEA
jgi:hypothetical protein